MRKIKPFSLLRNLMLGGLLFLPLGTPMAAEEIPTVTEDGIITGTMDITFATRTQKDTSGKLPEGSPAVGVKDVYTVDLKVATTTEFSGKVERQPRLFSKLLSKEVQPALLDYALALSVLNPSNLSQKKEIGKWVGIVPIDENGLYNFGGGDAAGSALRVVIDTVGAAKGFESKFGGKLKGRAAEVKKGLLGAATEKAKEVKAKTFSRVMGKKEIKIEVTNSNPMHFDNLVLAAGPAQIYPEATVNGNLDFDYDTGNYLTSGIKFTYTLDGVSHEDLVTGTIKWEEEADRAKTGKGRYTFNLRFNEGKQGAATDESAVFDDSAVSAEEAFFVVDSTIPAMTGTIEYVDTFPAGSTELMPTASKITYNLNANKLTKQQIMNFLKLWLAAIGPTNDE